MKLEELRRRAADWESSDPACGIISIVAIQVNKDSGDALFQAQQAFLAQRMVIRCDRNLDWDADLETFEVVHGQRHYFIERERDGYYRFPSEHFERAP